MHGGGVVVIAALLAATVATAQAQTVNPPQGASPAPATVTAPADTMAVPGFWDPRRRPERPDLSRLSMIRFLTETDYPPFNYAGPDGDSDRLQCRSGADDLRGTEDRLHRADAPVRHAVAALNGNRGDAVIASIAVTPETRRRVDFSDPYYRTPARFVARRDGTIDDVRPEALEGKKIAVVAGTAHEAYLKTLFTEAELRPYPDADAARDALQARRSRSAVRRRHLAGVLAQRHGFGELLRVSRRAVLESRFFGEGVGIAVRRGNDLLRQAFNWALFRLWEKGRFTDLWLRYFPVSPF